MDIPHLRLSDLSFIPAPTGNFPSKERNKSGFFCPGFFFFFFFKDAFDSHPMWRILVLPKQPFQTFSPNVFTR